MSMVSTISGGLDATVALTSGWSHIFVLPRGDHTLMVLHSSGVKARISMSDNEPFVGQLETYVIDTVGFKVTPITPLPGFFQLRDTTVSSVFELRRSGVNEEDLEGRIASGSDLTLRFVCTSISADNTAAMQLSATTVQNFQSPSLTYQSEKGISVNAGNWKSIFQMIYPGTQDITIGKCYVIGESNSTIDLRLLDITNAQVIAEGTLGPLQESDLFNLGSITNLSVNPSFLELQGRKNSGSGKIFSFHAW